MSQNELYVHGSMFFLLRKFVESNYDQDTWFKINKVAGTPGLSYELHRNYPVAEMFAIISAAANFTGLTENELKEKFGENLVPDLLNMYKRYIDPAWKTFDMLLYTESVMHKAVRSETIKANPPVLNVTKVSDKLLIIDYYSKRKMASLAIGIIRGIAEFYDESGKVHIIPKTDPNDERVQIRVEFT